MSGTIFEMKDGTLVVKPVGELDSMTSPVFEEELRGMLNSASHVVIDFEQVEYISSAGLRVLLAAEQYLEGRQADMKLIHVSEHILEIFDLVGFREIITIE